MTWPASQSSSGSVKHVRTAGRSTLSPNLAQLTRPWTRRKKSRCPGERPACGFCVRLGQQCNYAGNTTSGTGQSPSRERSLSPSRPQPTDNVPASQASQVRPSTPSSAHLYVHTDHRCRPPWPPVLRTWNPALLYRTEKWHRTLQPTALVCLQFAHLIGSASDITPSSPGAVSVPAAPVLPHQSFPSSTDLVQDSKSVTQQDLDTCGTIRCLPDVRFLDVPPPPVLKALVDVYFANCQNQPYCFFLESSFRQRLDAGQLPKHLVLAFSATAIRYSSHNYFQDHQSEATEAYARAAWLIIWEVVFTSRHGLDLCAVQATSLLAIIDFTGISSIQRVAALYIR